MTDDGQDPTKKEVTFSDVTTECYPSSMVEFVDERLKEEPPLENIPLQEDEDAYERDVECYSYGDEESEWQSPQPSDFQEADRQPLLSVEGGVPPTQTQAPIEKNNNKTGLLLLLACIVVTLVLGATADPGASQLQSNSTVANATAVIPEVTTQASATTSPETNTTSPETTWVLDPAQPLLEPDDAQDSQSILYIHSNATTAPSNQTTATAP